MKPMGFRRAMMGQCSLLEMTLKFDPKLELDPTFPKRNRSILKTATFFFQRKDSIRICNQWAFEEL